MVDLGLERAAGGVLTVLHAPGPVLTTGGVCEPFSNSALLTLSSLASQLVRGIFGGLGRQGMVTAKHCTRALLTCSGHGDAMKALAAEKAAKDHAAASGRGAGGEADEPEAFQYATWAAKGAPAPPRPIAMLCCLLSFAIYYWDGSTGSWSLSKVNMPENVAYYENINSKDSAAEGTSESAVADVAEKPAEEPSNEEPADATKAPRHSEPAKVSSRSTPCATSAAQACGCQRRDMACFMRGFHSPVMERITRELLPVLSFDPTGLTGLISLTNAETDTHAVLGVCEPLKHIMVSFRGTASYANLRTDLTFLKRGAGDALGMTGPRVHEGFHQSYFSSGVGHEIEDVLAKVCAKHPDFDVFLTGHSLGGALAILCAYRVAHYVKLPSQTQVFCITFGSPRVGDPEFKEALMQAPGVHVYRFVHGRDLVPRMPTINYAHPGILLWLRKVRSKSLLFEQLKTGGRRSDLHDACTPTASRAAAEKERQAGAEKEPGDSYVQVYGDGTFSPLHQQCLCCNLSAADHLINADEVYENAEKGDGGMSCARMNPIAGLNPARWRTEQVASGAGEKSKADDAAKAEAELHFFGYMQALHDVPEAEWPSSEHWGGPSCEQIRQRAQAHRDRWIV